MNIIYDSQGYTVTEVDFSYWYIWAMLNHMVEHIEIKGV